jgi:hypothetical protein
MGKDKVEYLHWDGVPKNYHDRLDKLPEDIRRRVAKVLKLGIPEDINGRIEKLFNLFESNFEERVEGAEIFRVLRDGTQGDTHCSGKRDGEAKGCFKIPKRKNRRRY